MAAQIFWETPELAEKILPFLDLESTLRLAQSEVLNRNILQGSFVWNQLIRRSSPLDRPEVVKNLVAILKLMKDHTTPLLDLLDLICERSPAGSSEVQMACARHPESHVIRFPDFQLLEKVEGAFGTTKQTVELVNCHNYPVTEAFLFALSSRLSRQQMKMTSFSCPMFVFVSSRESAEFFKNVTQNSEEINLDLLWVDGLIGQEGWEAVSEGLEFHPGGVSKLYTTKDYMEGGRREDLRKIWDSLSSDGSWDLVDGGVYDSITIEKQNGEAAWTRLEQIIATTKAEWIASRQMGGGDQENGEDEEADEEVDVEDEEDEEEEEVEQMGQEQDGEEAKEELKFRT